MVDISKLNEEFIEILKRVSDNTCGYKQVSKKTTPIKESLQSEYKQAFDLLVEGENIVGTLDTEFGKQFVKDVENLYKLKSYKLKLSVAKEMLRDIQGYLVDEQYDGYNAKIDKFMNNSKNESINEENELDSSNFNSEKYSRDLKKFIALNTGYDCDWISKKDNEVKVDFVRVYKIYSNDRQKLKNKLKKIGLINARLIIGFSYSQILGFNANPTELFFKLFNEFYLEEDKKRKQKEAEEKDEFDKAVSEIDVSTFTLDDRDFEKMIYYYDKNSNVQRLADSVKDTNKALNRFVIAHLLNWESAENAFYEKLIKIGYDKVQLEAYKRKGDQLGIPQKFQDKIQVLKDSGVGGFGHEGKRLDNWAGLPKLDKWLNDNKIKYSVQSVRTPASMLRPDDRNGLCCTCAYELTIGDLRFIVANHTSETGKGGAYGYSMQGEGVSCYETSQQNIINKIEKVLMDNHILGNTNESMKEGLSAVKVTFDNGDVITTDINGTEKEIKDYYAIGKTFNLGKGEYDNMAKVVDVEILNESDREVKKIKFVTIDDWNRPIFRMKHNGRFYYLSDINNLFDYGTTVQRIKQFYKDKKPLRDYITFHGHRIDDDPMGTTMRFDLEIE